MWSDKDSTTVNSRDLGHHLYPSSRACAAPSCNIEQAVCILGGRYPPARPFRRTDYRSTRGYLGLFNVPDAANSWLDEGLQVAGASFRIPTIRTLVDPTLPHWDDCEWNRYTQASAESTTTSLTAPTFPLSDSPSCSLQRCRDQSHMSDSPSTASSLPIHVPVPVPVPVPSPMPMPATSDPHSPLLAGMSRLCSTPILSPHDDGASCRSETMIPPMFIPPTTSIRSASPMDVHVIDPTRGCEQHDSPGMDRSTGSDNDGKASDADKAIGTYGSRTERSPSASPRITRSHGRAQETPNTKRSTPPRSPRRKPVRYLRSRGKVTYADADDDDGDTSVPRPRPSARKRKAQAQQVRGRLADSPNGVCADEGPKRSRRGRKKPRAVKKYCCSQPMCEKSFSRSFDLRRHMDICAGPGEKKAPAQHFCDSCGRGFNRKDALGRHCMEMPAACTKYLRGLEKRAALQSGKEDSTNGVSSGSPSGGALQQEEW